MNPSPHMRPEFLPAFQQLVETYDFEPSNTLWVELLAGLLTKRETLSDEGRELLATMLKDLPERR